MKNTKGQYMVSRIRMRCYRKTAALKALIHSRCKKYPRIRNRRPAVNGYRQISRVAGEDLLDCDYQIGKFTQSNQIE
ncbi:MAG: hypothetical protein HFH36_14395, partial [Lachnospiraceae bacterium]|nr:hypothetical protein [Lachnospiraceae bacterium]